MKKQITITGMTCGSCKAKVSQSIQKLEGINSVEIDLKNGLTTIESDIHHSEDDIQNAIGKDSKYQIVQQKPATSIQPEETQKGFFLTYKPLLLIVFFIILISSLTQYPFDSFNGAVLMRHFMAGFFIVFSFFKLLNIQGFSSSYRMYDIVAQQWNSWGLIYPFVELALGIAYLINIYPTITNLTTVIVLGVSSIGVIKSNLDKRKIKCACLGDVFNLPMSKVTIVEDITMVLMATAMFII